MVDDSAYNLVAAQAIIKKNLKLNSDKAYDGKQACTLIEDYLKNRDSLEYTYKFILMDVNMPIMDGYEATR